MVCGREWLEGGNAGRATRVRTFAIRDAVLTGRGVAGMNMVGEAGDSVGSVGGDVMSVQWAARSGSKSASGESASGTLSSSVKNSVLNRDNSLAKPAFLPLDGLLRCHRAPGNNVTEEYSTQQPGKSQGYVRIDHRLDNVTYI
jgi:hypothetical protein